MKLKILVITAFLMVFPLYASANDEDTKWDYEKSKTIKKEFDVNADALLSIKNKYGNVDVISWDQNRIEIEVKITVSGNDESKVISSLSRIDVNFEASRSAVSAKTMFDNSSRGKFNSGNKINFEINYKVKMPVTNDAKLSNDYGNITLNEIKGKADINCDYGKIVLGSLLHTENNIDINYTSNSEIELMNGGYINADYSKIQVTKAKKIELNADYTDTEFENVEELDFNCDYGNIEAGNANVITGNGDYLTMRFGNIYKKLEINADYGGIKVERLMKGFEKCTIRTDYTGVKMGMEPGISFDFIVNLSYGGFSLDDDNATYLKKVVKSNSKYYEGYFNGENSGSVIDINSEYGSVKLYNH